MSKSIKNEQDPISAIYFSEIFEVQEESLEKYGAFNISLVNDLPLFIDPFLLFNSKKGTYQKLHESVIKYIIFLRDKVLQYNDLPAGMLKAWFCFPEVKQAWLGFCEEGNAGSGLGMDFAKAMYNALKNRLCNFGDEALTQSSHIEKVCLIKAGVGKDNISDFTANLIKDYLLSYTQTFAKKYLDPRQCQQFSVSKALFNYQTESWEARTYYLPCLSGDYVLLTPKDILRREDTWISRPDLLNRFDVLLPSIANDVLRFQINHYFSSLLDKKSKKKEKMEAAAKAIEKYPEFLDYYIRYRENNSNEATSINEIEVGEVKLIFQNQVNILRNNLLQNTKYFELSNNSYADALKRVLYLKQVVEANDGYKVFYIKGNPIKRESDLHVMYRLTCFDSPFDVNSEVNNGRGAVDYKFSMGSKDSTLIEFKLASNSKLKRNLEKQVETYKKANRTKKSIKVIMYFTEEEEKKVKGTLNDLDLIESNDIILIDARKDNKPSASIA